jgi:hypothetical protein
MTPPDALPLRIHQGSERFSIEDANGVRDQRVNQH